jgi:hypothetical protein
VLGSRRDTVEAGLRRQASTWCVQVQIFCGWVQGNGESDRAARFHPWRVPAVGCPTTTLRLSCVPTQAGGPLFLTQHCHQRAVLADLTGTGLGSPGRPGQLAPLTSGVAHQPTLWRGKVLAEVEPLTSRSMRVRPLTRRGHLGWVAAHRCGYVARMSE